MNLLEGFEGTSYEIFWSVFYLVHVGLIFVNCFWFLNFNVSSILDNYLKF
jgi:hypothetical protein